MGNRQPVHAAAAPGARAPAATLAVFYGPRRLARYQANGTVLGADRMLAA